MLFYKTQADVGTLLLRFPSLRQPLESFLVSFLLSDDDDTGNLCLKVLSSLPQLVLRGQQWELLSVTHAFVCKGPSTFIKPHSNEQ